MSDLPSVIHREILSRVPSEPLLRFRCVCKEWRFFIDDFDFAKLHLVRQMGGDMLLIKSTDGNLYSTSLGSLNHPNSYTRVIVAAHIKNVTACGVPPALKFEVMPSCHGLTLISHSEVKRPWVLWNPFTGEWLHLPPYREFVCTEVEFDGGGLGYDGATDDYKVVRVSSLSYDIPGEFYKVKTLIYSLKRKKWHRIEDFPNCYSPCGLGVFVNGALHWITDVKEQGVDVACIIALDLRTETYSKLPLPSFPCRLKRYNLDALAGCLFLSFHYMNDCFDLWILNDYGRENIWTKLISFEKTTFIHDQLYIRVVAYIKSKEQVVLKYNNVFLWFDVEKKIGKKITIEGIEGNFYSQVFPASLVRLNGMDDADEGNPSRGTPKSSNERLNLKLELKTSWCWESI